MIMYGGRSFGCYLKETAVIFYRNIQKSILQNLLICVIYCYRHIEGDVYIMGMGLILYCRLFLFYVCSMIL